MTGLIESLDSIPRLALGNLPSPVRLGQLSEGRAFWIKDDGRIADAYGGNKIRKLEYLLGAASKAGIRVLVTHGDVESHTVQATGILGAREGFSVHAVVFSHRGQSFAAPEVVRLESARAVIHQRRTMLGAVLHAHWLALRQKGFLVPLGATTPVSTLGFVRAALELDEQVHVGLLPEPKCIYLPFATCGSVAGLLIGLAFTSMHTRVVAVQTVERIIANRNRLERLVREALSLLNINRDESKRCLDRLDTIDSRFLGRGYRDVDKRTQDAVASAATCGLHLEAAFSGKAFASLLEALPNCNDADLLFWNTHDQSREFQVQGGTG
jgi:D-cysteine desulfhydrase